jgi:Tfp pilus assembly protein PilV
MAMSAMSAMRCETDGRGDPTPVGLAAEGGLSIIETLFAIVVIAIAFLGMAGVQAISSRAHSLGKNQGVATYVANQQLELMRRTSFAEVAAATDTTTIEGVGFNVVRTVDTVGSNKRVTVVTSWTDRFGPRSVQLVTVVSQVTNP